MARWTMDGTILIACNCDFGCPCNFNARPTHGFCEGGWSWLIDAGCVDDVRLDGLAASLYAKWPGAIHEGGGQATAYFEEKADAAQQAALKRLLRGELGGPWGIFINTYTLSGPHPASYETKLAGDRTSLRIGDRVELELQPIRNPVTGAEVHPEMVLPEGLVVKRASLAASTVFRLRDGFEYDHSGRYTAFGRFQYEGDA